MESIKFYCDNKPKVGEVVQVIFTNRDEDHATGHMTQYDCNIIMTYSQATKKKKIKSINKVIPLNKELTATLEDYDPKTNTGNVSRAYLDDEVEYFDNIFRLNQKLYQGIHQICFKTESDFTYMWKEKVYPFVQTKLEELNEKHEYLPTEKPSYLEVFIDYIKDFGPIIDNEKIYSELVRRFERMTTNTPTIKKKVGIISNDGVQKTKDLFNMCFTHMIENEDYDYEDIKNKIEISYSTPDFTIETKLSQEVLDSFVGLLVQYSKTLGNIYVKVY